MKYIYLPPKFNKRHPKVVQKKRKCATMKNFSPVQLFFNHMMIERKKVNNNFYNISYNININEFYYIIG